MLTYQWFIGERIATNFAAIPDATTEVKDPRVIYFSGYDYMEGHHSYVMLVMFGKVYWPKHEDIGKVLKVECTPILGDTKYNSIFAISSPVAPGTYACFC